MVKGREGAKKRLARARIFRAQARYSRARSEVFFPLESTFEISREGGHVKHSMRQGIRGQHWYKKKVWSKDGEEETQQAARFVCSVPAFLQDYLNHRKGSQHLLVLVRVPNQLEGERCL